MIHIKRFMYCKKFIASSQSYPLRSLKIYVDNHFPFLMLCKKLLILFFKIGVF
jgi:hypothetical protein